MKLYHANRLSHAVKMLHDPEYKAAKTGNLQAALRLVDRLEIDYAVFRKYEGFVCPVQKFSGNKIPLALAMRISQYSTLQLVSSVYLLNNRPGYTMIERMYYDPEYTGFVPRGKFILVDDVFTTGITLRGLKTFIESSGSEVTSVFTIGSSKHGTDFQPTNLKLRILKNKYPDIEKYFNLESLTIAQVEYLLRFTSFNRFLDLHYQRTHKNLFSK